MQTVSEFAVSVGYTVQAVNAKIRKLELTLEPDPIDNRKRLLSPAQCELLRSYFPSKAGEPAPVNTPPPSVYVEYQRPVEVGLVLAERSVSIGEISYHHQAPTDNPVLQLLQQRLSDRRTANASNLTKLQSLDSVTNSCDSESHSDPEKVTSNGVPSLVFYGNRDGNSKGAPWPGPLDSLTLICYGNTASHKGDGLDNSSIGLQHYWYVLRSGKSNVTLKSSARKSPRRLTPSAAKLSII